MSNSTNWVNRETRETLLLHLRPDAPGRELAWQEFHDIYAPIVAGFARNMGMSGDDVGDLVQDVMLGFFGASPQFVYDPARGRFRGYLKTCALRQLQKRVAANRRNGVRRLEALAQDEPRVDQVWNDLWEEETLHRAVEAVRRKYAARRDGARTFRAFELSALSGQSPDEIAKELEMSVSSVYQAKSRVAKAIKAAMVELGDLDE